MPNWYNRQKGSPEQIRYTATFPIDVWVEDTGDEDRNTEQAYNILSEGLTKGLNETAFHGFKFDLHLSDPKRYDRLI